jgi:hypothetical protein
VTAGSKAFATDVVAKLMLTGAGGGVGSIVIYVAWQLAKEEPKAFIDALVRLGESWGPMALVSIVVVSVLSFIGNKLIDVNREHGKQMIEISREHGEAQTKTAVAMEQLAAGVGRIAEKDDERQRENELILDHLARSSRDNQVLLRQMSRKLTLISTRMEVVDDEDEPEDTEKAHGTHAG